MHSAIGGLGLVVVMVLGLASGGAAAPALPSAVVATAFPEQAGATVTLGAGGNLQKALAAARPGDTIVLSPGVVYTGPFTLPAKTGTGWVVVRTAGALPPVGSRVTPDHATEMATLESASGEVITAAPGAHHYRFVGIEIRPTAGTFLYNLVLLGLGEKTIARLPHHIILDRCYIHGDPQAGSRRGVTMNGKHLAVIDSHVSDFKEWGADSQAIGGWAGPGPFKIANNYLEGAGENVMFGGADPVIAGVVPSDIEIRGNHVAKPLSWREGDPSYAGTPWTVKNLLELKNARRVLIDGNRFEYVWAHAQYGVAIAFTVRNQDGTAPWSVVEDVTFTNNTVRHVGGGMVITGLDEFGPTARASRFLIRDNVFDDVGAPWGGSGWLFSLFGPDGVAIERNVGFSDGAIIMGDGPPTSGLTVKDNVFGHGEYGVVGSGAGSGLAAIAVYFPGLVWGRNVIVMNVPGSAPPDPTTYPAKTIFATSWR